MILNNSYGQDTIYSIAYTPTANRIFNLNDRDTATYFFADNSQANNIWRIGTPVKTTFNSAHSSPLALVTDTLNTYPNNNVSSFYFMLYTDDLTYINFWHRINADTLNDGGVLEFSTDYGATWENIINSSYHLTNFYSAASTISSNTNKQGFTGTSGWIYSTIEGYAFTYVKFRFTFTSDNVNTNKDGWMIDDIQINCLGTGISEHENNFPFYIFPNPASDFISIHSNNTEQIGMVTIKDVLGKTIFSTDKTVIDLSQLDKGIYFMELIADNNRYVTRLLRN